MALPTDDKPGLSRSDANRMAEALIAEDRAGQEPRKVRAVPSRADDSVLRRYVMFPVVSAALIGALLAVGFDSILMGAGAGVFAGFAAYWLIEKASG